MLCRSHAVHSDYLVAVEVADGRSGVHSGYLVAVIAVIAVILVRFGGCLATVASSSEWATFALNLFCRSSRLGLWCWVRVAPCLCCACLCFCFCFALVRPPRVLMLLQSSSSPQRLPGRWRIRPLLCSGYLVAGGYCRLLLRSGYLVARGFYRWMLCHHGFTPLCWRPLCGCIFLLQA
jgi:hypothetical protein